MSRRTSYWQTVPGALTAIAGVITALTGLIVALHQTGVVGLADKAADTSDVRTLIAQMREMKEQIAVERARLEATRAAIERQPGASRDPALAGIARRVSELDASSGMENPEVRRVFDDPSLPVADKVTLSSMLMLKDLDGQIDEAASRVSRMPPGPSQDVETMRLKRLIDRRSQIFDQLRAIIDAYNQTAKGIIDSMGR